ncbi:MAG: hypothetical protein AAFQ94_30050 [Bacteroidota bacterium]
MKKILTILLATFIISSCSDENCNRPGLSCTEELRYVSVEIFDENGANIILDSTTTTNASGFVLFSQQKTEIELFTSHAVVSDSEYDQIDFDGTELTFEGWKDGDLIVSEPFVVGKDCCHIEKLIGPETITVQ